MVSFHLFADVSGFFLVTLSLFLFALNLVLVVLDFCVYEFVCFSSLSSFGGLRGILFMFSDVFCTLFFILQMFLVVFVIFQIFLFVKSVYIVALILFG